MSPSAVRFLAVVCCSVIAYCNGNAHVTAYVKEYLTTTTCVSVPQIRDVCNVDWKVKESDAESYNATINRIKNVLSVEAIYEGLDAGDAAHCRRMYENLMCKKAFPLCNSTGMVIDHGNAKARCQYAIQACPTIAIHGCEGAVESSLEPIISPPNKCEAISANTSMLCPGAELKVPHRYNSIAKTNVEEWSKIAELFSKELKTRSITAECEINYREVLCRLIDACSQDNFYYLHYINVSECEEMVSCVKSAGFSKGITSVCSKVLGTEDAEHLIVPNPYVPPEKPTTKVSVPTTKIFVPTTKIFVPTTKIFVPTTKIFVPTTKIFVPTTSEQIATSESLIKPTDENNEADKESPNNATDVDNEKVRGNASKNFQTSYLFTMVVTFFVGQTFYRLP